MSLLYPIRKLERLYVYCAQLALSLVHFFLELNLLAFLQRSVAIGLDCREMYEYILAAFVVRQESIALFCIKPFNFACHL